MAVIVDKVAVRDGNYAPPRQAVLDAIEAGESQYPKVRPTDAGFKHPQGPPREALRYAWRSTITDKTSNGCTYPNEESARLAGETHEKMARNYA